jgi:hypothetical protein
MQMAPERPVPAKAWMVRLWLKPVPPSGPSAVGIVVETARIQCAEEVAKAAKPWKPAEVAHRAAVADQVTFWNTPHVDLRRVFSMDSKACNLER